MNAALIAETPNPVLEPALAQALDAALQRIAPVWPLDRFIAVNPWWGFTQQPLPEAARRLHGLNGTLATWSSAEYRAVLSRGEITRQSLAEALRRRGWPDEVEAFLARPDAAPAAPPRLRLTDWLESAPGEGKGLSLTAVVIHAIGQHCASWFDQGQALWRPAAGEGLYAAWKRITAHDHGLSLLTGIPGITARLAALPDDPERLLAEACRALRPGAPERYFTALLLSVNGWAGWCAGLAWRARQQGGTDDSLRQLLAVRLAWDWVLADLAGDDALRAAWRRTLAEDDAALDDTPWIWQEALEIAWQADVNAGLARVEPVSDAARPPLEAVFCIDVRSEPLRRALEAQHPGIRTHGFAGFFGLPIDYLPPGGDVARPQLPGLLAPALRVTAIADSQARTAGLRDGIRGRLARERSWQDYRTSAGGGFGFVEALGLGYLWKLVRDTLGGSAPEHPDGLTAAEAAQLHPVLEGVSLDQAADLAAAVLAAMSLPRALAPWVLLTGHGSGTVNNPHAAGLDCGACCGQTGEVNARVLASILNDPGVRERLAARGVSLPADTRFIAALHDTVTDEITLYDPPNDGLQSVRGWLAAASAQTRHERAPALGLADCDDAALAALLRWRSRDWSEVRPEWGLANNAGFIAAPRERTRHLDLHGRCFLHDYDVSRDPEHKVLELILTAPVVVAHWINLQYYASTVDNRRWGSGDKVLHNIVGGNIGVFEGNGGDLRTGLPLQCLHDGQCWRHTPLRLTVWVEAPCEAVEAILVRHETVRALADGGWLHLACIAPGGGRIFRRVPGKDGADWRPVVVAEGGRS
ncbi:hypothetical protein EV700_0964 [Fluviicoccus keumensis]|uniref:Probable inorganic carbon transporter subunit DabA n=1 Tax=Fluviicoccus keumensis TaxID=1435465 RepID=A0A4Q7ZDA1_9GAMM|nr:DUF2309 domain-containing protein [Fluviicoccus keumensis]RZU47995.1 hypothetical protein EV700_0964 [Fluviicoccus keumensis]